MSFTFWYLRDHYKQSCCFYRLLYLETFDSWDESYLIKIHDFVDLDSR